MARKTLNLGREIEKAEKFVASKPEAHFIRIGPSRQQLFRSFFHPQFPRVITLQTSKTHLVLQVHTITRVPDETSGNGVETWKMVTTRDFPMALLPKNTRKVLHPRQVVDVHLKTKTKTGRFFGGEVLIENSLGANMLRCSRGKI